MENYESYSEFQLDVLREVGNIGAGNAATALSDMLENRVNISVPTLQIVDVVEMGKILGGLENEVVGILVNMTDEVQGMLLFLLDLNSTKTLIKELLHESIDEFSELSDIEVSALMEIGNILSGSYIRSISTLTDLDIRLSPPQISVDMVGAILSYPAAQFGMMGDKLLLIEESFFTEQYSIKSHLLIMPEVESLDVMLNRLGVN